jgi:hypothetical protein
MDYEEGDRVAFLRHNPASDEIQIIEGVVVGMVDEYQAVVRFGGGQEITWPVSDLTPLPPRG